MKLYDNSISSACARVRIVLALKGVTVDLIPISIGRDGENGNSEYLNVNPQGLVPALLTNDSILLTQSFAIIEYLEALYPIPPLLPINLVEAAWVRSVALIVAAEIHPLLTHRIATYINDLPGTGASTLLTWRQHWMLEGLDAIEVLLARNRTGRLCSGDTPTLADVFLYPQALNAERAGVKLERWPTVAAIMNELRTISAFGENGPALTKRR